MWCVVTTVQPTAGNYPACEAPLGPSLEGIVGLVSLVGVQNAARNPSTPEPLGIILFTFLLDTGFALALPVPALEALRLFG